MRFPLFPGSIGCSVSSSGSKRYGFAVEKFTNSRKSLGVNLWGQRMVLGPEVSKGGIPGCGPAPGAPFQCGGKTAKRESSLCTCTYVCVELWLCFMAARGVTAGNTGEPV